MTDITDPMLDALAKFRAKPKFRCTEPEFQMLNPSSSSVTRPMEIALNNCAEELSLLVKKGAHPPQLKSCIETSLCSLEKPNDTEDREYLAYYYHQLGECVGVKAGPIVNRWLYGILLSSMLGIFSRG